MLFPTPVIPITAMTTSFDLGVTKIRYYFHLYVGECTNHLAKTHVIMGRFSDSWALSTPSECLKAASSVDGLCGGVDWAASGTASTGSRNIAKR